MSNNSLEIRNYSCEFRADTESRTIAGLAIPVESRSLLLGDFYEVIRTSAVNEELIMRNDVKIYLDHDPSQGVYARSRYGIGSLHLSITERGLEFSFEAPHSVFGDALLEGINRGDYSEVSFGFYVGKDDWEDNNDGTYTRSILSFAGLEEISILGQRAAYPQTDVATRSFESFKEEQRAKEEEEQKAKEEKEKEIIDRLDKVMEQVNDLTNKYTV